jgi:hypothetical protein
MQAQAQTSSIDGPDYLLRIDALEDLSNLPLLPWLKQGNNAWKSGKPTFDYK